METRKFNQPERQAVIDAYKNGTDEQKQVLVALFGEIWPQDIRERVKTFEDACRELGEHNLYVEQYRQVLEDDSSIPVDVFAYYKIRIICAALNEGWKPDYTDESQLKYYPWIYYADEDYVKKHPEEKWHKLCLVGGAANSGSSCGSFCVPSTHSFSHPNTNSASRSAYKSSELAIYAGEQFFDIYADYLIK